MKTVCVLLIHRIFTLKALSKFVADDILYYYYYYFGEKKNLALHVNRLLARQTINIKCQAFFIQ